jgi:hypothetical protein
MHVYSPCDAIATREGWIQSSKYLCHDGDLSITFRLFALIIFQATVTAIGSIVGGIFANLPVIVAPPTAVSIFLALYLEERNEDSKVGNSAVVLSGLLLILFSWRPLGTLATRVSADSPFIVSPHIASSHYLHPLLYSLVDPVIYPSGCRSRHRYAHCSCGRH